MQASSFQLTRQGLGGLPIIEHFLLKTGLPSLLEDVMGSPRYTAAILLLLKNILMERVALYAIQEWAGGFAPALVHGGTIGDDTLVRALDRLFKTDRASLMTRTVLAVIREFKVEVSEIHQDTTSVKLFGEYERQQPKGVQLKRGHSKDHRPDLKQLVYELSVTHDGAVPVHFKVHDGNRSDDSLHWENWLSLRGLFGRSDFLYIADSKLCVGRTLLDIDREHGKFITMMPRTRTEIGEFADRLQAAKVRFERLIAKRSSRKAGRLNVYEVAVGPYQIREGFRLYWFRSSEKKRHDEEAREACIDRALDRLRRLVEPGRKMPRTEAALKRRAEKILIRSGAKAWVRLTITLEQTELFKQKTRGRSSDDTDYRKVVKWVPRLTTVRDLEAIVRSEVMDGTFPLVTNTDLTALEVLNAYKYQPQLEKRHAMLKSALKVAPIFLKKNDRIEALMFVYFLAQLVAALIERQMRLSMKTHQIPTLAVLPEDRPSSHPTVEQLLRLFEPRARHLLFSKEGSLLQTFVDPLTPVQQQVLRLLEVQPSLYA
jgi:transposase